jgi:hypothetical protein
MHYTVHSFVALSRLRPGAGQTSLEPAEERAPDALQTEGALRFTGSARVAGVDDTAPWWLRSLRRLIGRADVPPRKDRFEFDLVVKMDPDDSKGLQSGLVDLRKQLGLGPDVKSAVIEIFVRQDAEHASKVDHVVDLSGN